MDLQALQSLVDVAQLGSFAAAAHKHNKDPSVISRQIAGLEAELQIRLFKRSTRKLSLTEAGARYLTRVRPLLAELAFAEEDAKALLERPSGVLKITASVAFGQECVLPYLARFMALYPYIDVELQLTDSNLDLLSEDIDLACRLSPAFTSDMVGIRLMPTRYWVCASPAYMAESGLNQHGLHQHELNQPEDLAQHPCLVFALPKFRSRWQFKDPQGQIIEVKIPSRLAISSALALREATRNGLGPALLADWLITTDVAQGRLVRLFPEYQATATDFDTAAWLLYPSRQYLPQKTRVFIDFIRQQLS